MYKDKAKQKEANKRAKDRYLARVKAEGIPEQGIPVGIPVGIPEKDISIPELPANFDQPDCGCGHCQNIRASGGHKLLNHGPHKTAGELKTGEYNRVALPGDTDYKPQWLRQRTI